MQISLKSILRCVALVSLLILTTATSFAATTSTTTKTKHHVTKHHTTKHTTKHITKKSTKSKSHTKTKSKSKTSAKKHKSQPVSHQASTPEPDTTVSGNTEDVVRQIAIPFMRRNNIPGLAVEVYVKGVPHSYYFGYANRERRYPVTGDTIFEIASITKLFTALLVAQEINAGKMNLNDPIMKHVPRLASDPSVALKTVTLKNLCTHTANMPFNLPSRINDKSKLSNFLSHWHPSAPVGSRWRYSNVSIGLLGFALEAETHENLNGLYQARILRPLGMQPLGINVNDPFHQYYAQGYAGNGRAAPRRNGDIWLSPPTGEWMFPAAGAIKASSKDMALFLRASIGLPGTPKEIVDAMHLTQTAFVTSPLQEQGLGWVIHPDPKNNKRQLLNPATSLVLGSIRVRQLDKSSQKYQGDALMEKTGATGGFRSYIAVIPDDKSGVVLLMNRYISSRELKRAGRNLMLSLG